MAIPFLNMLEVYFLQNFFRCKFFAGCSSILSSTSQVRKTSYVIAINL